MQENADKNKIGPTMKPISDDKKELEPVLPVGRGDGLGDGLDLDFYTVCS